MLDFLLQSMVGGENPQDVKATDERVMAVQAIIMDLLGAGHDTTANLMSFCLGLLAQHPETQEKLREEVQRVLKDCTSLTPLPPPPKRYGF